MSNDSEELDELACAIREKQLSDYEYNGRN